MVADWVVDLAVMLESSKVEQRAASWAVGLAVMLES
jgi:hypothetical protein